MSKNEKGTEAAVFARLDEMLAAGQISLTDSRYRIAKVAGYSPGGAFYVIVERWLAARREAQARPVPPIDPAIFAKFEKDLDTASANAKAAFQEAMNNVAIEIDRTAGHRVAHAEKRAEEAIRENEEILADLEQAGCALAEMAARFEGLEAELRSARADNQRLLGRIEETERTFDKLTARLQTREDERTAVGVDATASKFSDAEPATPNIQARVVPGESDKKPASKTAAGDLRGNAGSEEGNQTQPLASEDDQRKLVRPELPLVSTEQADEA